MCVEIEIDCELYSGVGELAAVLRHLHFEPDTPPAAIKPDNCLCYLDLKRTAEANGFTDRPTEDRFHAIFERK
jgi:hypothetical protein